MTEQEQRDRIVWQAEQFYGLPYRWGGDDPMTGFDCSGLAVECLQGVGVLEHGTDYTADELYRMFRRIDESEAQPGDLVFWVDTNTHTWRAVHVGIIVAPRLYIGADGGGRRTQDADDAAAQNAFIKLRPWTSRGTAETRRFATPFGRRND